MNARALAVLSLLTLGAPRAEAAATLGPAGLPPIEPVRAEVSPVVDGVLDDPAWGKTPLELGEWLTYNPLNGSPVVQRTEVRITYDSKALYFAFHCIDPEPDKIRGTLSRRDQHWNDDWVGLSLDSMGNGQASYDLFVNPRGVQGDVMTTSSAGENSAPDWVWQSAASKTPEGYDVELRLPLTSIRFKSGETVPMGILFWRRVSRLGVSSSWPSVPAGKSFIESHAKVVFHDLKRPLTLELIPSLTYSWNQARVDPVGFGAADSTPDAGLSAKYGLTSAVTVEGTFNPDFSQVESDAFQVEVNQRYPLFFSEKRPFFMEGMGTFELAGAGGDSVMRTAVHTRRIADPRWGGKLTGTLGRATFATLSAGDEAPGRPVGDELSPFPGDQKLFNIGRAVYSLGPNSYAGALVTDTEFGDGFNRVGGLDVSLKRGKHSLSATGLATTSRSAAGDRDTNGLGGQTFYAYESKRFLFANQLEHYDRDFQMDTAFLNQTGDHRRLGLHGLELLPRREEAPLAEAHRALRVLARPPRRDPGRRRLVRAARAPHALHPAGLLPGGHGMGAGALGAADLQDEIHPGHRPGPDHPLAQPRLELPVRPIRLLRRQRPVPGPLALVLPRGFPPAQLPLQSVHVLESRELRSALGGKPSTTSTSSTRRRASSSTAASRRAPSSSTTARASRC